MKYLAELALVALVACQAGRLAGAEDHPLRIATFSADVTIPLGHRCMGILPTKSQTIADPLEAHGFVLLGAEQPIVLCTVDWCEIRNGAYDQWRQALADAASTVPERVLVSSVHQHDAPVVDREAARLLAAHDLAGELYDEAFHQRVLRDVAAAVQGGLREAKPVTHVGVGAAQVDRIASNRRIVLPDGRTVFHRGSRSGGEPLYRDAPEGEIDPLLRTISFWQGEQPVVALHAYATHPMSYYGAGEVSADFVGAARRRRQADDASVRQIYASGCSGDVTAGKYNDGSPEHRAALTDRLYAAMVRAWDATRRVELTEVAFRNAKLSLDFHPAASLTAEALTATLADESGSVETRVLAAMGLSSRQRVARGEAIDMPCIDLGAAQIVLFPGEAFVGYQLLAQQLRPASTVMGIGYGECWPGYIPTEAAFRDVFEDDWLWVAPGSELRIRKALQEVLRRPDAPADEQ